MAGCGVEELSEALPVCLPKFHLLTGPFGTDMMVEEVLMMDG